MAAKRVIVLETSQVIPGLLNVRVAFWFQVAANVAQPRPDIAASAFTRADPVVELAALKAGTVIEELMTFQFPVSMSAATIESFLAAAYTDRAAAVAALPQKGQYYGVNWDGTTWGQVTG